jgi:hypothetical protein
MRRLLSEPLLHFLVLGMLLFGFHGWLQARLPSAPDEIVVSRGQVRVLQEQFQRVWQRPATSQERQGLVDGWIREEVFYREGLAMGLDRDDPIVRRRVGQKLQFITEAAGLPAPTTAELQAWLDAHRDDYRNEARYSLRQVYFDPARHAGNLEADVAAAWRALDSGGLTSGDPTLLPANLEQAAESEVARVFGAEFAAALRVLPVGGWQGPVRSGFGMHLVELGAREDSRPSTLEEVRAAVERDWLQVRSQEADAALYAQLRAKYRVRIEADEVAAAGGE